MAALACLGTGPACLGPACLGTDRLLKPALEENHRKIIGKLIGIIIAIFGPFMRERRENNRFKSFLELTCTRLVKKNHDFIILSTKSPNSMIS